MRYKVFSVKKSAEPEKKPIILEAVEDTYVVNGDDENGINALKDTNFGNSDVLFLKGNNNTGKMYRRILMKFDISSLKNEPIKKVTMRLFAVASELSNEQIPMYIYEVEESSWNQNEVTFNTVPDKGELVATATVAKNNNFIDLTDYIKKKINEGKDILSFMLVGDDKDPRNVRFASSKNTDNKGPSLVASYTDCGFLYNIASNVDTDDLWAYAAELVDEWASDWDEVSLLGDHYAEFVHEKPEEYAREVDVAKKLNPYQKKSTRTLDSIIGYEPVKDGEIKLDEYGGYICDKKFNATGWFHVEEKYGRLWTVTPLGNPFFKRGIASILPGGEGRQINAVMAKCGSLEGWVKHESKHLRDDLHFNSVGGWSAIDSLSKAEKPLALTQIVGFVSLYARLNGMNNSKSGSTTFVGGVIPVFNPEFVEFADERAKTIVTPYANDPHVYGWMSDNELPSDLKLLDSYLMADTENPWFAYSYATAWTFMRTVTGKESVDMCDVTDEHRKLFRAMVYNRYFRLVSSAVKKYAPNHMFIGSRFLPGCYRDEYVHHVSGKWCDVISLNYYGAWAPESELMQNMQKWSGTPFIITEWYAKGMDVQKKDKRLTNESGAGFTVRTQKERGYFYHNFALKLMECKGCAGFDWFKMWDNDPDNLKADLSNRNSNKGIYDSDYEEYSDLTDEMKLVNENCYKLIDFFDADSTRSN